MKQLPLKTILQRYRDVIRDSAAIDTWCRATYGKPLTIIVGFDDKKRPPLSYCPSCVIFPGQKMEGDGADQFAYMTSVAWSIVNDQIVITDNVREYAGVYESDDLGHLILSELASASDYPIASVDYSLEAYSHYPQFPGRADLTVEIPQTMGGSDTINF